MYPVLSSFRDWIRFHRVARHGTLLGRFLLALAVPGTVLSPQALAQTLHENLWVTNGPVNAVATSGSTIYLGGAFTQVGPATGSGVAIDASTGAALLPYASIAGVVRSVAPDGSGGWYIGGTFTAVQGQPRGGLARLDASGNLASWNPNASGGTPTSVSALVVSGSTVYVGGSFSSIGGQARNHIAALDATTGTATGWNPNASSFGPGVTVFALAVSGGTVYAGGVFTSIGGQSRNHIAALDAVTGAATGWDPNPNGFVVSALAASGATVYAAGQFSSMGGQARNFLAALDAATGTATNWNPGANSIVNALALSGGTVYVGGGFSNIGGQVRNRIAAIDAATGTATSWDPNASGSEVDA
jgi:hypothetical protein